MTTPQQPRHTFNREGCIQDLDCPAPSRHHTRLCPWHPQNVSTFTLNEHDFDALLADLDAASPARPDPQLRQTLLAQHPSSLTPQERKDLTHLVRLLTDSPFAAHGRMVALFLKYPTPVWLKILDEAMRLTRRPTS